MVVAAFWARCPAHSGVAEQCLIEQARLCSLAQTLRAARHRRVRCGVGSLRDSSRVACARWPARTALARQRMGRTGSPIRTTPMAGYNEGTALLLEPIATLVFDEGELRVDPLAD